MNTNIDYQINPFYQQDRQMTNTNGDFTISDEVSQKIREFVHGFLFPYIRGSEPDPDRVPMMTLLLSELEISDPEAEEEIRNIASEAYYREAAQGLYVHLKVISPNPFRNGKRLPEHLQNSARGSTNFLEERKMLTDALYKNYPLDFPGSSLSKNEIRMNATAHLRQYFSKREREYRSNLIERKQYRPQKDLRERKMAILNALLNKSPDSGSCFLEA